MALNGRGLYTIVAGCFEHAFDRQEGQGRNPMAAAVLVTAGLVTVLRVIVLGDGIR